MSDTKADSPIIFTTRLTEEDWDSTLSAWRCPSLAIPKARIEDLFVDGNRLDKAKYEVRGPGIRWIAPNPPRGVTAQIRLGEELSLESETDRWKKLAVVLPFVAALVGAAATYLSKSANDGFNNADLVNAHFNDWSVDKERTLISFRLTVVPIDFAEYIKKSDKDKYKLIVGVRSRTGTSDMDGQYEYALDFPFDSTLAVQPQLNDRLRETIASGCVSLILFRVSALGLARIPFKTPFIPAHYGQEIKMLESEYDGRC
jgi:hypothetical protein